MEREIDGERVPLPFIIRKTNIKPPNQIQAEIRNAQTGPLDLTEIARLRSRLIKSSRLPGFLRRRFWHRLMHDAYRTKHEMGTVMVTSLGMFGKISAWPLPSGLHTLVFGLGSKLKKPWIVAGRIGHREILNLTVMFDHDLVDGAPAARFVSRLSKLIEGAYGLKVS
ncbi:2-oxo acid dehydrogenase subunit E2 [candidate division WOR-3 bacterium]|nr:2-oxo acid dehydrogenase subunit E2 [candidate division WOR-3 bacterium]